MSYMSEPADLTRRKSDGSDVESFGERVRRRRKEIDLSQEELATRVGCSQPTISNIERGEFKGRFMRPVAKELGLPVPFPDADAVGDELDNKWLRAGYTLREISMKDFRRVLDQAERWIRESLTPDDTEDTHH